MGGVDSKVRVEFLLFSGLQHAVLQAHFLLRWHVFVYFYVCILVHVFVYVNIIQYLCSMHLCSD